MRIAWLGVAGGKVVHWHALRKYMEAQYGVDLMGPGYSWGIEDLRQRKLSELNLDKYDVVVWDDRNSSSLPLRLKGDRRPDCKFVFVEQDYHNKARWMVPKKLNPDVILGSVLRPAPPEGHDPWKEKKQHPTYDPWVSDGRWALWPYPVDTTVFKEWSGEKRLFVGGVFGVVGPLYPQRREVRRLLVGEEMFWRGPKGKRSLFKGECCYGERLARKLCQLNSLWVDGSSRGIFLGKYHEGIACGCRLIGQRPYGWNSYYPDHFLVEATPEEFIERAWDTYRWSGRRELVEEAMAYCQKHHSVESRAVQFMEVVCGS